MTSQLRRHYVCRASINGTFYNSSVTRIVTMIQDKNCEKLSKSVKVTAKILSILFSEYGVAQMRYNVM